MVDTGKKIKELRISAGLTQKELGAILNVSFQAVSKWERGMGLPDPALFPEIAKALGTDVNTLFYPDALNKAQKSAYKPINGKFIAILSVALAVVIALVVTLTVSTVNKNNRFSTLKTASIIFNNEQNIQVKVNYNGETHTLTRKYFFDGRVILCWDKGDTQSYFYKEQSHLVTNDGVQSEPCTLDSYLNALPKLFDVDLSRDNLKSTKRMQNVYRIKLATLDAFGFLQNYGFSQDAKVTVILNGNKIRTVTAFDGTNGISLDYTYGYDFTFSLPDFLN